MLAPRIYDDRRQAGRVLAQILRGLELHRPLVLALPRGGVVVGDEVARALDAPLRALPVAKIGAPGHPELALGSVVAGEPTTCVLNEDVVAHLGCTAEDVARAREQAEAELLRRRSSFGAGPSAAEVAGRDVVVVDDGAATGATLRAALVAARGLGAGRLLAALPVAPEATLERLSSFADRIVCPLTPSDFVCVGENYRVFDQTTDEEVRAILRG